jgi:acetyl-CoA synthetase
VNLAYRYLEKTEFESYEDFCENLKIKVPGNFNFAYDIMDEYAKLEPERLALIWCNDHDEERFISFAEMKKYTDKAANVFKKAGIKKGDKVMLILRRRYEFYFALLGLTKLGAIVIPSTDQLTEKDIIYRNNAAKIKLIVAYNRPDIIRHVEGSLAESPTVEQLMLVGGSKEGWLDFDKMMAEASEEWTRPTGEEGTQNNDIMLIYFTSGTTSMPKMTVHDFTYPLGHIITAKYWQKIIDGGIHLTVADSGWAKFAWGKLYGQWICGAIMFMYDMERFDADHLLKKLEKYRIATFCAPPTVYRFMLQQDLDRYDLSSLVHCSTAGEPLNPEVFQRFYQKNRGAYTQRIRPNGNHGYGGQF